MIHFKYSIVVVMVICYFLIPAGASGEAPNEKCYVKYFRIDRPFSVEEGGRICIEVNDKCSNDSVNPDYYLSSENLISEIKLSGIKSCVDIEPNMLKNKEAGFYIFYVRDHNKNIIYEQSLIIETDTACVNEAVKMNISRLIKKHAPILKFDTEEEYYPISIETLFNSCETIGYNIINHSNDSFLKRLFSNKNNTYTEIVPLEQIVKSVLSNRGSSNSELVFIGTQLLYKNPNASTVYASYKTYPKDRQLAIQYWFFYPYDPKQNKIFNIDSSLEHHGDWEMITIKFINCNSDFSQCDPETVGFSEHLSKQKIECVNGNCKKYLHESWDKPGIAIPWKHVQKQDEKPFVFIARGSHASYPYAGEYKVTPYIPLPEVGAIEKADGNLSESSYNVEVLPRMCEISSNSQYGWLLFSGKISQEGLLANVHQIFLPPHQVVDFLYSNPTVNRWLDPITWVDSLYHPEIKEDSPEEKYQLGSISALIQEHHMPLGLSQRTEEFGKLGLSYFIFVNEFRKFMGCTDLCEPEYCIANVFGERLHFGHVIRLVKIIYSTPDNISCDDVLNEYVEKYGKPKEIADWGEERKYIQYETVENGRNVAVTIFCYFDKTQYHCSHIALMVEDVQKMRKAYGGISTEIYWKHKNTDYGNRIPPVHPLILPY